MNIALFGYGKMGQMIEQLALDRNHIIVSKINKDTTEIHFSNIDVAIDFSTPEAAYENISRCIENNIPVISGTTGWLKDYDKILALCKKKKGSFIYASNFSLGVNIFFELNTYLAGVMKNLSKYQVSIEEIHHTQKLDAPSGTAISLAEGIIAKTKYNGWKLEQSSENEITITSAREGAVPGTHKVAYESDVDSIEIKHTAHNREGFALGAIVAAEWLFGKTGVYTMKDVLGL